jgi:hypothetical protein
MTRIICHLALVLTLFTTGACVRLDYVDCYAMEDRGAMAIHLVEYGTGVYMLEDLEVYRPHDDVTASCEGFDGVEPGITLEFSNIGIVQKVPRSQCSFFPADVALGDETLVGSIDPHDVGRLGSRTLRGVESGPATVAVGATVAGCTGTWALITAPVGLVWTQKIPPQSIEEWTDEVLFDRLTPGGPPPVVVVREFLVDDGTSCPALGGTTGCVDVFSAYYEPAP